MGIPLNPQRRGQTAWRARSNKSSRERLPQVGEAGKINYPIDYKTVPPEPADGRCECCRRKPEKKDEDDGRKATSNERLCMDHDHTHPINNFRAWLCSGCNCSMGLAADRPEVLRWLANLIERHRLTRTD